MLKTSPILSNSPSASPSSFRNVPPQATAESPRRSTTKQRKAPSWPTPTAPSASLDVSTKSASQNVTQASEPPNPPDIGLRKELVDTQNQPPQSPNPQTLPSKLQITPGQTSSNPTSQEACTPQISSPNKRRGSPGQTATEEVLPAAVCSSSSQQDVTTSKRTRHDEQPPKVLPNRYELCAVEDMVELIAYMLAELIATNDAIRISNGGLTRFHSRTPPGISVRDYLHRLAKHATLTPPLLLAMVYYIDRLCALYQEFTINTLTVHRFLITAATVAAKGLSDSFWNNTTYARVGGVRVAELKLLELEFLYRVDWKIVPNPEVLVEYYQGLVERTPGYALESDDSSEDEDEDDVIDDGEVGSVNEEN